MSGASMQDVRVSQGLREGKRSLVGTERGLVSGNGGIMREMRSKRKRIEVEMRCQCRERETDRERGGRKRNKMKKVGMVV